MQEEIKLLKEVYERQKKNLRVVYQCASYLNHTPTAMSREQINSITAGNPALEQSAYAMFLANIFCENEGEANELFKKYYVKSVKCLNADEYKSDPYYKNIKIPRAEIGKWNFAEQSYMPYEAFVYRDIVREKYTEIPQIGYFNTEFSFPCVYENGIEWMAIKPNEIETMKTPIKNAKGKALVYGLGLGYFAYMISLKKEVDSITIVERDESVISLFRTYILPQFEHKEKINIVQSDAFEYAKERMKNGGFDYVFADLWHDASDGVDLYVKMKKQEHFLPNARFDYWIEPSILSYIRSNIIEAIYRKYKESGKIEKGITQNILNEDFLRNFVKIF